MPLLPPSSRPLELAGNGTNEGLQVLVEVGFFRFLLVGSWAFDVQSHALGKYSFHKRIAYDPRTLFIRESFMTPQNE